MSAPTWRAPQSGQAVQAGDINQFLGLHATTYIATGALFDFESTTGASSVPLQASGTFQYAQQVFANSTFPGRLGYVGAYLQAVGSGADVTITLFATTSGVPTTQVTSTVASQVVLPAEFIPTGAPGVCYAPLPISGLTPSTIYAMVLTSPGTASNYVTWQKSVRTGAAFSGNGSGGGWVSQPFGMRYELWAGPGIGSLGQDGRLAFVFEDGGARWSQFVRTPNGTIATVREYTGAMRSQRTVTAGSGYIGRDLTSAL
jgi:hypothetical protein